MRDECHHGPDTEFHEFAWQTDEEAVSNGLENAQIAKAEFFDDCEARLKVWRESSTAIETVTLKDGRRVEQTVRYEAWYMELTVIGVRGVERMLWNNSGLSAFEEDAAKKMAVNAYKQRYAAEAQSKDRQAELANETDEDPNAIFPKWR